MITFYLLKNKINDKGYVGQTNNFKVRMRNHKRSKYNCIITHAIQKYGWNNFSQEPITIIDTDKIVWEDGTITYIADWIEYAYQKYYNTFRPNGYNVIVGGQVLRNYLPELIKKLSDSHRGQIPWNKGKKGVMPTPWNKGLTKETDERVRNLGDSSQGRHHTEETKELLRQITLKQFENGMPEETRQKLSAANKGHIVTDETRKKISIKAIERYKNPESRKKASDAAKNRKQKCSTTNIIN